MITEFLVFIFIRPITGFLNWFPAIVIPTDLLNSLGGIIELLASVSYFMPVGVLQLALIVFIAFHGLEFIISIVNWIIAKIPTID